MLSFGLIGAAGFVAPRHMQAIKTVGGRITAAFDPNDSVGVLDRYFPDANFFVEFERFDRHVDKLRRRGEKIDWISICSPNYLHDAHCRFALRSEASAVCEKPLVLNPWNLDGLESLEASTGQRVFTVLQLRLHPAIAALKAKLSTTPDRPLAVDLTYIAGRGQWYHVSWKGNEEMSGGVATNIGVHFFDALIDIFGCPTTNIVHLRDRSRAAGLLICGRAAIRWFLSIDRNDLPAAAGDKPTFRSITIDNEEIDFTDGFTDLHVRSYDEIIAGRGYGLDAARPAVELISRIRSAQIEPHRGELHPLVQKHLTSLPRIPHPKPERATNADADLNGPSNPAPASDVESVA
jgi:UDP-N-acetyl-2-amino-2-deoxyglucuronate dehydrogenase